MLENRKRNKAVILFALYLILGIIIRLYYLDQFSDSPIFNNPIGADVEEYTNWANGIIAGKLLWDKVHIHSPLYPYFLALLCILFSSAKCLLFWVRFSQLTIGFVSVIPLFLSLKIAFARSDNEEKPFQKLSSIIFLFLWLFYPPLIYYLGELTSEVLLIPLLSMALYSLYKWEKYELNDKTTDGPGEPGSKKGSAWLAGAGIFAGLAVITHPISLFFIIFESIYLLSKIVYKKYRSVLKKQILNLAIFAIAAMIPVIPMVIYNTCILNEKIPIQANSGFNLYLGNGPEADGTCRLRPGPEWDSVHSEADKKASELGISKDRYFFNSTIEHIISNPLDWLSLLSKKSLYVWNHNEITAGADVLPLRYFTKFQRSTRWSFGFCATLAIIAILLNLIPDTSGKRKKHFFFQYRHFLLLILAFWVAQTLLVTSGRYRVAMIPSILILSSAGISSILHSLYFFSKRSLLIIPAIAIALTIVYLPSPPLNIEREKGEAQTLYGEALLREERFAEAEKCLISAINITPNWTRNYNLLGIVCEKQWKLDAAEALYNSAIEINPDDPDAYVNLATLYSSRKLKKSAEEYFNKALSLNIGTSKLHYNYALYCFENGDEEKAVKHYKACLKLNPAHHMSLNNLGTISFQNGKFDEAADYFETALRIEPKNAQRILNLSLAYLMGGNPDKAQKALDKASSIDPNIPEIRNFQSMIDKELKKQE